VRNQFMYPILCYCAIGVITLPALVSTTYRMVGKFAFVALVAR